MCALDITGEVYGQLTAIQRTSTNPVVSGGTSA